MLKFRIPPDVSEELILNNIIISEKTKTSKDNLIPLFDHDCYDLDFVPQIEKKEVKRVIFFQI